MTGEKQQLDLGLTPEVQQFPRKIPGGYRIGKCRSCGTDVLWCASVDRWGNLRIKRLPNGEPKIDRTTGRKVPIYNPIDPAPRSDGNMRLIGNGRVQPLAHGVYVAPDERYISHFATCPNADKHRRRS